MTLVPANYPQPIVGIAKKTLVIGSTGHGGVTCAEWSAKPFPNIVDFDLCVVNLQTLSDLALLASSDEQLEKMAHLIRRLLYSGGTVIVLMEVPRSVKARVNFPGQRRNYEWLPFGIQFLKEEGNTIIVETKEFPSYLAKFKKWNYHHLCVQPDGNWRELVGKNDEIRLHSTALVKNREGRILVSENRLTFHAGKVQIGSYDSSSYVQVSDKPFRTSGSLFLIPSISDLDERLGVSLLLQDIGIKQREVRPEWVSKILVPGTEELQGEIQQLSTEIDARNETIAARAARLAELNKHTRLIYGTGSELEEAFRAALKILGAEVVPAKYANEEYILVWNGKEYLVEVKGNTKSASLDDLRQILDYTMHYQKDTGNEGKGILFVNAWRLLPANERGTSDKPIFPADVQKSAIKHGIAIVSSIEFFEVFCKYLRHEVDADWIVEKIINTNGEVTFSRELPIA